MFSRFAIMSHWYSSIPHNLTNLFVQMLWCCWATGRAFGL